MKKYILLPFIIILLTAFVKLPFNEGKLIYKLEKPVNAFTKSNTNTMYSKSTRGGISGSFTPLIEMVAMKNEGFVIRNEFYLQRFNCNFKRVWEINLVKNYGLQGMPSGFIKGNENITYFIEVGKRGAEISVQKINISGKLINNSNKIESTVTEHNTFLIRDKLYFLNVDPNKKTKKLDYKLYGFDSNLKIKENKLIFPVHDYELSSKTGFGVKRSDYLWKYLGEIENRVVFYKNYFKELKSSKSKELVLETIELDSTLNLLNHKIWNFEAYIIDESRKFIKPTVVFDEVNRELYFFGYISVESKKINGLYLIKHNYDSQIKKYSHESTLKSFMRGKASKTEVHFDIPMTLNEYFPLALTSTDFVLDKKNRSLSIQIIVNSKGLSNWRATYMDCKFDKYGDHIATNLVDYRTLYYNYGSGIKSIPTYFEYVYSDFDREHLKNLTFSAEEYVKKNFANPESKDQYYLPIDRNDYGILVTYDENRGEFRASKIEN